MVGASDIVTITITNDEDGNVSVALKQRRTN